MFELYSSVIDIRRKVFAELARLAYEDGDIHRFAALPYNIIPGEDSHYRDSIFLERAIVSERLRLAMGLPLRPVDQYIPTNANLYDTVVAEKYYEPPLVNIIKFACHACPEREVIVSSGCQGCLAHPCKEICPKNAISVKHGKSVIDPAKCVKCGRCVDVCPYHAIIKMERPCAKACGMGAIRSDEKGHADIDYNKCVSCGQCIVNCPFGAIADKSQIFQVVRSIKHGHRVVALIAPAFVGQFGPEMTSGRLEAALKVLGFDHVADVAVGADLCAIDEAKRFMEEVPEKQPFMITSCCPSWIEMTKKMYPELSPYVSMSLTPMVLTARLEKQRDPDCKIVFVGPCSAKKLEAMKTSIRSYVDYVLTFEELMGMFQAKDLDFSQLPEEKGFNESTGAGRNFAVSGGVAKAVVDAVHHIDPDFEVKTAYAEGLQECRKLLAMAKAGKYNGYLLEGMGCPGGCIAGMGTLQAVKDSQKAIAKYKEEAEQQNAMDSKYDISKVEALEKLDIDWE
ncbi:MAG: 4Fe-4S dicluster domain-containing protein [Negativibacillus sp.]